MRTKREINARQVIVTLPVEVHSRLVRLAELDDRAIGLLSRRFIMNGMQEMEAKFGIQPQQPAA